MKTIGILTSGGDAPGMNAAIRAIARTAFANGLRVKGIRNGFDGLIKGDIYEMNISSVADIVHKGGTILGSARSLEFKTKEGQDKAMEIIKNFDIDGIVVLGGDGSFQGANVLHERGIKTIGIPCTIDNDMGYTDWTIGFDTAVETCKEAISKLRDTSSSHGRGNVVEVMGRNCGDIALYAGVAGGAESILVPEVPVDMEQVISRVQRGKARGKLHHIVVVAEGIGNPQNIAKEIQDKTGVETKLTILGHVQRGGSPALRDAIMASEMGVKAVELLMEGKSSLAIGIKGGKIFSMYIPDAIKIKSEFNTELYTIASILAN
ncbi:6-phosphofructokinase [Helcococcus ovis]|uniref:ATP-dependent 6-phosphofructokinase n=2 Tax=Bacteria TaxID=2 RepID=A0A4R9C2M6_9FIRM|nr:6-phosphofructokinase [Helcococcus ovis]TFF65140.1 6-phosphofructokinase [Helcococcus ovis]TFF66383.1 6-phosphofructokinase [Helcococcus ovis]TFF68696.1 6-phosphofructokinase [Helcococcus ovis]WNZ01637.1 6-phosphofructokinase [Helcococcus ovis]